MGLPRWLRVKKKNLPANAETMSSISGSGIFPEEGNGNPLQCSCLGNLMDRGAWQGRVHGVTIVVQDLVTKPPPPTTIYKIYNQEALIIWHRELYSIFCNNI